MKSYKLNLLSIGAAVLIATLAAFGAIGAQAAAPPLSDYQAHVEAVKTLDENAKAAAIKRDGVEVERQKTMQELAKRLDSKDALLLGVVESMGARLEAVARAAASGSAIAAAAPVQLAPPPPPPQPLPECGFVCVVSNGFKSVIGGVKEAAVALGPTAASIWGAKIQAGVAVTQSLHNRDIQINSQNANAGMFRDAGNTNAAIAASGFTTATALGSRPTVGSVTNNGNNSALALFDSRARVDAPTTTTTTITNTVQCPGGQGGTAQPSTTSSTPTETGPVTASSSGVTGAPGGAPGCSIGK